MTTYDAVDLLISPIKRDQIKKKLRLADKEKMRKSLPVLDMNEIRRYRLPYEEALIIELNEKGYPSSAGFLTQILEFHAQLCKDHGPDSIVSSRPKLSQTRKHLDRLYNGLIKAEAAHYEDKIYLEIDELLHLGIFFGLGSDNWWWLGEQLLIQSVTVSGNYDGDGGEREAISRFIFGKFLIANLKDEDRAIEQLDAARSLSIGKNWTAFRILKDKQKSVYMETCGLLTECYIKYATTLYKQGNDAATAMCAKAIMRAKEACENSKVAAAHLLKGRCDMLAGRFKEAILSFRKALNIYKRSKTVDEACEARIQLALAYLAIGNFNDSAYQLKKLLDYATENKQTHYMGRAYRYLGEYYLNHGSPHIATPILMLAMNMFHELNDIFSRDQVKNLAAVSQGQEYLPAYIKMVSTAESRTKKNLTKLINWKDSREPFWSSTFGLTASSRDIIKTKQIGGGGKADSELANVDSIIEEKVSDNIFQMDITQCLTETQFKVHNYEDEDEEVQGTELDNLDRIDTEEDAVKLVRINSGQDGQDEPVVELKEAVEENVG